MKKAILCFTLASLLLLGGQAYAELCTIDAVPAATMLLPYFEVDLNSTSGVNTLFEINNATAVSQIAHVVVWTDLSVPVLDFNVYLTGYDVVPISMRNILNLDLPNTGAPTDPGGSGDTKVGPFSLDPNPINVLAPGCFEQLPPPSISPAFATGVQNALTGQASSILGGNCGGVNFGDGIARGYVTIDVVRSCNLLFPGNAGYFAAGGTGEALNDNVFWGNYYIVEPGEDFAQGNTMVHIEADGTDPRLDSQGDYTFYGRYVTFSGADNREPLATNFAARYLTDPNSGFDGTDLLVWRDSKTAASEQGFTCGTLPSPFPLGQEGIVIFDEMEQPDVPESFPISPQPPGEGITPFPWEAQRVEVNGPNLPSQFENGWMYLNLNHTGGAVQPADSLAAQAWVVPIVKNDGRFSVGYDAVQLDSACNALHFVPSEQ